MHLLFSVYSVFVEPIGYPSHIDAEFTERLGRAPETEGIGSIRISKLQPKDTGWYKCYVRYLNRAPSTAKPTTTWLHLDVFPNPSLLRFEIAPPNDIYVKYGEKLVLTCQVSGKLASTAKISWSWTPVGGVKKRNLSKSGGTRYDLSTDSTEMTLHNITEQELGGYSCQAKSETDDRTIIETTTYIRVAEPPRLVEAPKTQRILELQRLEWHCGAVGKPENLSYTWTKNGMRISNLEWTGRTSVDHEGTLIITKVYATDAGNYSCSVTNGIGQPVTVDATLQVEYPARVPNAPTLQYLPLNVSGMISCPIDSNPPVDHIQWIKDGEKLNPYVNPAKYTQHDNGSMFIDDVNLSDAGYYRCKPFNRLGNGGLSPLIHVKVEAPPTFKHRPRNIYRAVEGDSLRIRCESNSRAWKAKWMNHTQSELAFGNIKVKDTGEYVCQISSAFGVIMAKTQIIVSERQPFSAISKLVINREGQVFLEKAKLDENFARYHYIAWFQPEQSNTTSWKPLEISTSDPTQTVFNGVDGKIGDTIRVLIQALSPEQRGKTYEKEFIQKISPSGNANKSPRSVESVGMINSFLNMLNEKLDVLLEKASQRSAG